MHYIERTEYMQRVMDLMGTPDIKIITGIRRSGKSGRMKALGPQDHGNPAGNMIFKSPVPSLPERRQSGVFRADGMDDEEDAHGPVP